MPVEQRISTEKTCDSGKIFKTETDNFGDFWVRCLEDDRTFSLTLKKYSLTKTMEKIVTDKEFSLGDIPMPL